MNGLYFKAVVKISKERKNTSIPMELVRGGMIGIHLQRQLMWGTGGQEERLDLKQSTVISVVAACLRENTYKALSVLRTTTVRSLVGSP